MSINLRVRHQLLYLKNCGVHVLNVIKIRENEGFGNIEATGNDILHVFVSQSDDNTLLV